MRAGLNNHFPLCVILLFQLLDTTILYRNLPTPTPILVACSDGNTISFGAEGGLVVGLGVVRGVWVGGVWGGEGERGEGRKMVREG